MYHVREQHSADDLFTWVMNEMSQGQSHTTTTMRAITRLDTTKTTVRVQCARAPPRWTDACQRSRARQAIEKSWTDSPFWVILKNIPPVSTFTTAHAWNTPISSTDKTPCVQLLFTWIPAVLLSISTQTQKIKKKSMKNQKKLKNQKNEKTNKKTSLPRDGSTMICWEKVTRNRAAIEVKKKMKKSKKKKTEKNKPKPWTLKVTLRPSGV